MTTLLCGGIASGTQQEDYSIGKEFFVRIVAQLQADLRRHELTAQIGFGAGFFEDVEVHGEEFAIAGEAKLIKIGIGRMAVLA